MTEPIDQDAAHRLFAATFFNRAWDLLVKGDRTALEAETMIDLAHASRLHWRHRDDRSPKSESVSAWQLSRVYSAVGRPDEALRHGTEALDIAVEGEAGAFYTAYGHEAVARAAVALGDAATAEMHLVAARDLLSEIDSLVERDALTCDLESISPR